MKYITYDYEEPGGPDNYWHIYTLDNEPEGVDLGEGTVLTIRGPDTEEMRKAVEAICIAIDAAIDLSLKSKT